MTAAEFTRIIKNWSIGIETYEKMIRAAKQCGCRISRYNDTMHVSGRYNFTVCIEWKKNRA